MPHADINIINSSTSPDNSSSNFGLDLEKHKRQLESQQQSEIQKIIISAFDTTYQTYSEMRTSASQELLARLLKAGINGSMVKGITDYSSMIVLLKSIKDWHEVVTTNEEHTYQGLLPKEYKGVAAYATVGEIHQLYGVNGLTHIHFAEGVHEEDSFYAYTPLSVMTDVFTVQLTKLNNTPFKQWFAGRDVYSILQIGVVDTIVRCNWRPRIIKH